MFGGQCVDHECATHPVFDQWQLAADRNTWWILVDVFSLVFQGIESCEAPEMLASKKELRLIKQFEAQTGSLSSIKALFTARCLVDPESFEGNGTYMMTCGHNNNKCQEIPRTTLSKH